MVFVASSERQKLSERQTLERQANGELRICPVFMPVRLKRMQDVFGDADGDAPADPVTETHARRSDDPGKPAYYLVFCSTDTSLAELAVASLRWTIEEYLRRESVAWSCYPAVFAAGRLFDER